jgi:hypothetical protein
MTPPTFPQSNGNADGGNDLRYFASIASNRKSAARNIAPNYNQNRPLVTSSQLGQLQSLFNIASRRTENSPMPGTSSSSQSGMASLPMNSHNHNAQDRNRTMTQQRHLIRYKSYKDDRRGFILFVHVLFKILGKIRSERDLFYKVKSVVRECLSCSRAGIAGYSPLVDVMEARLREIDGLQLHLLKAEGYMHRYRQKNISASYASSASQELVVQI